jgi:hypothetical protein
MFGWVDKVWWCDLNEWSFSGKWLLGSVLGSAVEALQSLLGWLVWLRMATGDWCSVWAGEIEQDNE